MRSIGLSVFLLGTVVASCYAARVVESSEAGTARILAWFSAAGIPFLIGLVLMIAGGMVARRSRTSESSVDGGGAQNPKEVMSRIVTQLDKLTAPVDGSNARSVHEALDTLLEEEIPSFLESRQALIDRIGLGPFAEMIGQFASMERNLARAWSAITDEATDEATPCIARAREAAAEAQSLLNAALT